MLEGKALVVAIMMLTAAPLVVTDDGRAIVGDVTSVLKRVVKVWKDNNLKTNESDLKLWWNKINNWKKIDCLTFY